jgi:AcrR family transcriptional regulator
VFCETGIRDAPVELICDRAGFTRGAFYSNFASKEELFLAVYQVRMAERVDRLRVAVTTAVGTTDPRDQNAVTQVLQEAGRLFMESLTADEAWYLLNAEFRAQALRQPELRAPTSAAEAHFHDQLAEIMTGMLDRLGMRLTVEPRSAVITIVSLYETMLERTLLDGQSTVAESRYVLDVLPRLLASLITPRDTPIP